MSNGLRRAKELADYFSKTLNTVQEDCYSEFFEPLSEVQWVKIFKMCMASYKFFPTIAEINDHLKPKDDVKDVAYEMAGVIIESIPKFGYCNAQEAKDYLGPEAWFAVEMFGGWSVLCETKSDDLNVIRAQLRDVCKAAMAVRKRGVPNQSQSLMQFQRQSVKKLGNILKDFSAQQLKGITYEQ